MPGRNPGCQERVGGRKMQLDKRRGSQPTSMGARPTHAGRTDVAVDWLSFSISPLATGWDFVAACGWDVTALDYGGRGYESSGIILGTGRIYWSSIRNEMHISLGGQALASVGDVRGLAAMVRDAGGSFSRVDIALDDRRGVLDWATIESAVRQGHLSTRWRSAKISDDITFTASGTSQTGRIVRFGSRKSRTYLRCYDKQAQLVAAGEPDPGHWIRFELESKHEAANVVADLVIAGDGDKLKGMIRGLIEFKTPNDGDSNRRRWDIAPWWDAFLDGVPKVFGLFVQAVKRTLDDVAGWLRRQVAPSLALLLAARGGDVNEILELAREGRARWKPEHRAMLAMATA